MGEEENGQDKEKHETAADTGSPSLSSGAVAAPSEHLGVGGSASSFMLPIRFERGVKKSVLSAESCAYYIPVGVHPIVSEQPTMSKDKSRKPQHAKKNRDNPKG